VKPLSLVRRLVREPAIRERARTLPRQVSDLAGELGASPARLWLDLYLALRAEGLVHPDECLMLMQFDQNYRSNNLNVESTKELYWRLTGSSWKIVYEGNRNFPSIENKIVKN